MISWTLVACILVAAPPIRVAVGGDLMLNGVSPRVDALRGVAPVFREADLALLNLEIPLTDAKTATARKTQAMLKARTQFILKADPKHLSTLTGAGIDGVSLGNNHAMDYGREGLRQMLGLLNRAQIRYAGAGMSEAEAFQPTMLSLPGGRRLAMLSALCFMSRGALQVCTPAGARTAGIATLAFDGAITAQARARLQAWVGEAKGQADLVLVMAHWGLEKQTVPTPYQIALGRAMVDAGADAVVGHHPHVLQGAELYQGKPILYSLGNLVSPRGGRTGVGVLRWKDGRFEGLDWMPAEISGGQVKPITGNKGPAATRAMADLSRAAVRRSKGKPLIPRHFEAALGVR